MDAKLVAKAVAADDARPAGKAGECFYCKQSVGGTHSLDCVSVRRRVRMRVTIEFEADVPQSWGKESIEFQRNESSYCQSSFVDELRLLDEKCDGCLCQSMHFDYVGEVE